jgi:hypothetical protein
MIVCGSNMAPESNTEKQRGELEVTENWEKTHGTLDGKKADLSTLNFTDVLGI